MLSRALPCGFHGHPLREVQGPGWGLQGCRGWPGSPSLGATPPGPRGARSVRGPSSGSSGRGWTEPVAWDPPTPGFWLGVACGESPPPAPCGLSELASCHPVPRVVGLSRSLCRCREGRTVGLAPSPGQDGPGVSAGSTGHPPQCAWASGFTSSARTPGIGQSSCSSFNGAPEPTAPVWDTWLMRPFINPRTFTRYLGPSCAFVI